MAILLICFNFIGLIAQHPLRPYETIKFTNIQPVFQQTYLDSTLYGDLRNEYNGLYYNFKMNSLQDEDYIYSTFMTVSTISDIEGIYLDKRDIQSGEKIWEYTFCLKDQNRQEIPRLLKKDVNGDLILLSQRRLVPPGGIIPFLLSEKNLRFVERKINGETGELLSIKTLPDDDTRSFQSTWGSFINSRYASYVFPEGDNYRYIEMNSDFNPPLMKSIALDNVGGVIDNTIDSFYPAYKQYRFVIHQRDNGNILFMEEGSGSEMYLNEYTTDFSLISNKKLSQLKSWNTLEVLAFDDEHLLIKEDSSVFFSYFLLYDAKHGNLIWKIDVPNGLGRGVYSYQNNKIIGLATQYNSSRDNFTLRSIEIDSSGTFTFLKELNQTDNLRQLIPLKLFIKDDVVILLSEDSDSFINNLGEKEQDANARANSLMAFNWDDLNFPVSNKEIQDYIDLKIYPNPAHEFIEIRSNHSDKIIEYTINDVLGTTVLQGQLYSGESVDIQMLKAGCYFLNTSNHITQTFIKW